MSNKPINREAIYSALFAKLCTINGLATTSRKLRHWVDVPAAEQPALFVIQKSETPQTTTGQPSAWRFDCDVYIYANTADEAAPSTKVNELLDQLCNLINEVHPVTGRAVLPDCDDVHYCRINGTIQTDEGVLGDQAVCIVPITMLVAAGQ